MLKKVLTTPVRAEDIEELRIGDVIYLTGTLVTARDDAHMRLVKQGRKLPVDLNGLAIFHAGPIMVPCSGEERSGSGYKVVSIGPTTSMRMEKFEREFIAETGVKVIVGMGAGTVEGCRTHKALHCVFPGGCAVLAASKVEEVTALHWPELGMPEAMWVMRVREFGPLIVSIDTKGGNLFEENKRTFAERKQPIVREISAKVDYFD